MVVTFSYLFHTGFIPVGLTRKTRISLGVTIGLIHKEVIPCISFFVQVLRVDGSCLDSFFLQAIPSVDHTFGEEVLS